MGAGVKKKTANFKFQKGGPGDQLGEPTQKRGDISCSLRPGGAGEETFIENAMSE